MFQPNDRAIPIVNSMKKLLTILICSLALTTYSQTNLLDIGVEGGVSLASLRGNDFIDANHSSRMGYSGGLFVQFNFRKIFSVRTGGYYERKGSSIEIPAMDENGNTDGTVYGKENFDYLTVPLLLRATFGEKVNYFVNTGPYIGFLMKQWGQLEAHNEFPESSQDRTENFKKIEAGVSLGLGLAYNLNSNLAFSIEARNNLGLTETRLLPVYGNGVMKTNALNFLVGISYKPGQR